LTGGRGSVLAASVGKVRFERHGGRAGIAGIRRGGEGVCAGIGPGVDTTDGRRCRDEIGSVVGRARAIKEYGRGVSAGITEYGGSL
jgi:hypothetical protein